MIGRRVRLALLVLVALAILRVSCIAATAPRNIIVMIGDGMGIGAITAARCTDADGRLAMDTMPYNGLVMTSSANKLVTDSAAAATALATGVKTNNGMIATDPNGKRLRTILELARDMKKSTGVISTKFITDATPAAFMTHDASRKQTQDIASQMIASGVNIILGGGKQYFLPKSADGKREDNLNLLDEAKKQGYDVFDTAEAMNRSTSDHMLGLFAKDSMLTEQPEPTISEMTAKAISTLNKNIKGFFLMSEGGQIDTKAAANDADGVVKQTLMFDDAVRAALDFAKKDKHTLVIVTADHTTGGMDVLEPNKDNPKLNASWATKGHDANMVAIYAYGPGAELFTGTHDNTDIPKIMAGLWRQKLN